jgi:hypothetical protein
MLVGDGCKLVLAFVPVFHAADVLLLGRPQRDANAQKLKTWFKSAGSQVKSHSSACLAHNKVAAVSVRLQTTVGVCRS